VTYQRYLLGTTLLLLVVVAVLNFSMDPAGIYREGGFNPNEYTARLIKSKEGLFIPEDYMEERAVVKALAKYAKGTDCVVIGSSHVMQLSSKRNAKFAPYICQSILNLGVSGASIEDHLVLSYLTIKDGAPKKIVLGIDPWTFAFGKDQRWSSYRDDYLNASSNILGIQDENYSPFSNYPGVSKLKNLINMDYTTRSIKSLIKRIKHGVPVIADIDDLDPAIGGLHEARLNDGSHVYSSKFIENSKKADIPLGGVVYKTEGVLNQKEAIQVYRSLLLYITRQGVTPIFVLTPYHENVWKSADSANVKAMRSTEHIVRSLAAELNLSVIGSYMPQVDGCLSIEFYDFMHPTADCTARLKPRSVVSHDVGKDGQSRELEIKAGSISTLKSEYDVLDTK